jgi:Protein of unknown function (DUF3040)
MSLSEHDLHVLAELEHDFGSPSLVAKLCLLAQAARSAWGGLLLPAAALVVGAGLLAAGFLSGWQLGELISVAGIMLIFYAVYAGAAAFATPRESRKRA